MKRCKSGRHVMSGSNILTRRRTVRDGVRVEEACRACHNEYQKQRYDSFKTRVPTEQHLLRTA